MATIERRLAMGRDMTPFAVAVVDLDDLREVNVTLGRATGDRLLGAAFSRLRSVAPDGAVFRIGGDEFLVLLDVEDAGAAARVAEGLRAGLSPAVPLGPYRLGLPVTIGIALAPEHLRSPVAEVVDDAGTAERLLRLADAALIRARRVGDAVAVHQPWDETARVRRLQLVQALREAVDRNELELRFQPIVDLRLRRVTGAEALIRWRHSDHGLVFPDEFIELAELSDSIHTLTRWLLEATGHAARELKRQQLPLVLSANLSVRNVVDPALTGYFDGLIAEGVLEPASVQLEITETRLLEDQVGGAAVIADLAARGIATVVDDFGTGYASLQYLQNLPVKGLKLDRRFVEGLPADVTNRAILAATVRLAHELGMTVTTEGVADAGALEAVIAAGADYAQGFHLCEPVPVEELPARIAAIDERLARA